MILTKLYLHGRARADAVVGAALNPLLITPGLPPPMYAYYAHMQPPRMTNMDSRRVWVCASVKNARQSAWVFHL